MRRSLPCLAGFILGASLVLPAIAGVVPADGWLERARLAENQGHIGLAVEHLERHLREFPSDVDNRLVRGRLLLDLGRVEEAEDQVRISLRAAPSAAPVQLAGGLLLHRLERFADADACFARFRVLKTDDGLVENFLGCLQGEAGRLEHAAAHFQRAAEALPQWGAPRESLGRLCLRRGRAGEALRVLEEVVEEFPEEYGARVALAQAMLACRLRQPAVDQLRVVVEGAPAEAKEMRAEALRILARLYDEAGLVEPAVTCYEAAILVSDEPHPVLDDLARLYHGLGRVEDGRALLTLAVKLEGRVSDRLRLARVLESMGRFQEALEELSEVAETGTSRPELFWAMARLQERLGRSEQARSSFDRLLMAERRYPVLGQRAEYLWMVAERSLGSMLSGVALAERGHDYLARLQGLAAELTEEGRAAVSEAARRCGLPPDAVAHGRMPRLEAALSSSDDR